MKNMKMQIYWLVVCKGNYDSSPCSVPELIMTTRVNDTPENLQKSFSEIDSRFYYNIFPIYRKGVYVEKPQWPAIYRMKIRRGDYNYLLEDEEN